MLGLVLASAMFAVATTDLALPAADPPGVGQVAPVSYRVPGVNMVQELDEKALYWRVRFEIPVGKRLTAGEVKRLRALEENRRPPGLGFALGLGGLLLALFVVASLSVRLFVRDGKLLRVQLLLFLPLVLLLAVAKVVFLLTPLSVFWIPLAAFSMTWAIMHTRIAGMVVGVVGAAAAATLFPLDLALAVTLAGQALVPPLLMDRVRKRRSPGTAWLGGCAVGLLSYVGYHWLVHSSLPTEDLRDLQRSGLLAVLGAAAMSPLLAYVLRPLLQPLLGVVSSSRLMKLSDLDHPLLVELAEEAPGTWQHTLAMANLAEVVCASIGADSKLARVGAYYHDVGKLTNPRYFAENLESGEISPHLELAPEESASFIFEHVTEGERLARRHKLPYAVREFIFTHHGDGLLEFFWHKCQEQGNPRDLPREAFCYPGIRPRTKETAVLAVVDAVEAASRTLRDPDADRIDSLVRRIVVGKLGAGQLDEAGLTGADLAGIISTLQEVLRSQHHVRPEYPWQKKERQDMVRRAQGAAAQAADADPRATGEMAREPAPSPAPGRVREPAPSPAPGRVREPAPSPAPGRVGLPVAEAAPEDQRSPAEELSAALEGDLTGPVPIPQQLADPPAAVSPEATASSETLSGVTAPTAGQGMSEASSSVVEDTIREPGRTSGGSNE